MQTASAQDAGETDCTGAREVVFPLSQNDFSGSEILAEGESRNALYYLYQDKYTFWYRFAIREAGEISFSVKPSDSKDRYGITMYSYAGSDFCDKLVNQGLDPFMPDKHPMFGKDAKMTYKYSFSAKAGEVYFLSVLSMNPEDCGHFLYLASGDEDLSLHAVHRPCYRFGTLEAPDFKLAKIYPDEVGMYLADLKGEPEISSAGYEKTLPEAGGSETPGPETGKTAPEPTPEPGQAAGSYDSFSETLVESAEEDIISVGDRLVLKKVFFYNNTYAFKPEADEELHQLLEFLRQNPTVKIEIEGHSANNTEDIRPDPNFRGQGKEWNFKGSSYKLSEKRAEAVKEFLKDNGVHKKRVTTVGYGDTRKRVPDAATFEEFEQNMRVEILITDQ